MFSSKIIKQKDKKKNNVRAFCLKQFPSDSDKEEDYHNPKKDNYNQKYTDVAHEIKARAQHEAHLILESARREASRIQQQAFEQGFADGLREGRVQGEAEFSSLVKMLSTLHNEFASLKERFYEEHQDIILELALKIARSVIHNEIRIHNDVVVHILKDAIRLAMDRERLKIRVNPEDLSVCLERKPEILKSADGIKQIIFEPDETIAQGGALIEYAFGEIDARIDQQFFELEDRLRKTHLTDSNRIP